MLRRIAGPGRRPDEQWVDWVKRATRAARKHATNAGVRLWLDAHLRSKWCWAGHVVRMSSERIAARALKWRDSVWWANEMANFPAQLRVRRLFRTHWFRWEDELKRFAVHCSWSSWQAVAQQRDSNGKASTWNDKCKQFIQFTRK